MTNVRLQHYVSALRCHDKNPETIVTTSVTAQMRLFSSIHLES